MMIPDFWTCKAYSMQTIIQSSRGTTPKDCCSWKPYVVTNSMQM